MSVIACTEQWEGRDGDEDQDGVRNYTRVFLVQTDSGSDTASTVHAYSAIPAKWSAHPGDSYATARSIKSTQLSESSKFWKVTVAYSTRSAGGSSNELENQNQQFTPLNRAAKISWSFAPYQRAVRTYHENGDPSAPEHVFVNRAGEEFENVTIDDSRPIIKISKNMVSPPSWILDYQDAVNSDAFMVDGISIPTGCAKMQGIEVGERVTEGFFTYRVVSMHIQLRREGWELKIANVGLNQLAPVLNTFGNAIPGKFRLEPILVKGRPTTKPVLLASNGTQAYPEITSPDDIIPLMLQWPVYRRMSFSALPLS